MHLWDSRIGGTTMSSELCMGDGKSAIEHLGGVINC
jgi:hypothetical protein